MTPPTTAGSASAEGTYQPCSVPLRLIIDGAEGVKCNRPRGHDGPHMFLTLYAHTEGPQPVVTTYNLAEIQLTALRAAVVEWAAAHDGKFGQPPIPETWVERDVRYAKALESLLGIGRRLATEQP